MQSGQIGLLPVLSEQDRVRYEAIVDWWNQIRVEDDPGATTWEVLGYFERLVTDCLIANPPKLTAAESWTAQAMLYMAGQNNT